MMYQLFYRYRDALPSARQLLLEGEQISTLIEEKWHFDKAFCHNEMNPSNIILTDSNGEFPTRTLLILTSITGISHRFRIRDQIIFMILTAQNVWSSRILAPCFSQCMYVSRFLYRQRMAYISSTSISQWFRTYRMISPGSSHATRVRSPSISVVDHRSASETLRWSTEPWPRYFQSLEGNHDLHFK